MAQRFEGKVVAITGSGSGLGRETAMLIASEGGNVVVSDVVESRAKTVVDEILAKGQKAVGLEADVTSEEHMDLLVKTAVDTFGRLDAMHANAGIAEPTFGTKPTSPARGHSSGLGQDHERQCTRHLSGIPFRGRAISAAR